MKYLWIITLSFGSATKKKPTKNAKIFPKPAPLNITKPTNSNSKTLILKKSDIPSKTVILPKKITSLSKIINTKNTNSINNKPKIIHNNPVNNNNQLKTVIYTTNILQENGEINNNIKKDNNIPKDIPNNNQNLQNKNTTQPIKKQIINKNNINKVINKNNNEVNIQDFIEDNEDAVLKAYALPAPNKFISLENVKNNTIEKNENTSYVIEENNLEKINEKYIAPTTKKIPMDETEFSNVKNKKIITTAKKGANVNREKNNPKSPSNYEPLLEDGREIKRSFTIQENIKIMDFLINNGVEKNTAEVIAKEIENKDKIHHLIKGQYVILTIEKTKKHFKQHKINENGDYSFKKLVLFFDNIVIYKLKNNVFQRKIVFPNSVYNNFYVVTWKKFQDFYNYFNTQIAFSSKEYSFLSALFPFLIDKLEKQKIPILSIQLIFQFIESKNKKKIRGILIHTQEKIYCCFIYKDFSGNYHLLNEKGNSFNLEVLDIQKNPPINGRISSLFGVRKHPILKQHRHHDGLDLSAPTHTPVHAVLSGWVLSAGFHKSYGNYVIISYGNMVYTLYGHLNKLHVMTGDYLDSGRVVGTVGNTGRSSGPHLHYEIFTSDVNFFTIDENKVNILFSNRTVLNPILRYKIGIGLRTPELPYFFNLLKQLKSNEEVIKHIPFFNK